MNKLILLMITISISLNLYSQTDVSGNQTGIWTAANSPYHVIGEIIIPSGQSLQIEPGVKVDFQDHYKFTVNGMLEAVGTETDSIRFTTSNPSVGWGGIRIESTSSVSTLSYCRIEFGKTSGEYPDIHGGGLALIGSDALISHTVFADNDATADNNGMGGAIYAAGTGGASGPITQITNCDFIRNHAYGEGGAIKFTGDMNTTITSCRFIENDCKYGGGAISLYSVLNTKMTQCLFVNNYTLFSNGGAIHSLGIGNSFHFENCTIYNNNAVTGDGGGVYLVYADATFINCIIRDNPGAYSDDVYLGQGSTATINYCNTPMPANATGSYNIDVDPLFINTSTGDFHLQSTSPCIDAGTDIGLPYVGAAPDMGCYEYGSSINVVDYKSDYFTIYPNPSKGLLKIKTNTSIQNIKLIDVLGKLVINKNLNGKQHGFINTSKLTKGPYVIVITAKNGHRVVKKIIL